MNHRDKPGGGIRQQSPWRLDVVTVLLPDDDREPDPATWWLVELELTEATGDMVEVKLFRPLAWLLRAGAIINGRPIWIGDRHEFQRGLAATGRVGNDRD